MMPSPSPWTWPVWWRVFLLLNVSVYNSLGNAYAAGVPPLFSLIMQELRITPDEASQLSTYVLLTLGVSNVFALPAAALIGKRYTVLISLALFLAMCVWSAEATSFTSLLASRILGGLAGGLIEAMGPSIVFETFPAHQLASAMVVYVGLLAAGSSLGPIVAGAIADGLNDWRWFFRILAIVIALNLGGSIVMLPETTHDMDEPRHGTPTSAEDGNDSSKPAHFDIEEAPQSSSASVSSESLTAEWMTRSFSMKYVKLDWKLALRSIYEPYQLIILPQVLVTTLVFGLTIGWTVLVSIIIAMRFGQPPLLWSALAIGLLSIGPLVGLLIGLPIGGPVADFLFNRASRRHEGREDPRSRLPAVVFGALVSPAGCLIMGFGLKGSASWILVAIGWAMLALGLTSSANVLLTYSVHTIPSRASHIGALVNLTKNCLAFGVSYTSVSWTAAVGPVGQFGTMAGLLLFSYLLVIPLWFYNDALIRRTSRIFGQGM
ncbi:hypothetical protein ACJ41O_012234 [Fusarium nematophilum]